MKAIFLALVLINLAYVGWQAWIVPAKAPPAPIEADGVPRLVLIGEDPNDPIFSTPYSPQKMTVPAAVRPAKALPAQAQTKQQTDDTTSESTREPTNESIEEPIIEPIEEQTAQSVASKTPDPAPAPIEIPEPVIATSPTLEVAMAPVGLRCVSLGPFLNLREATEATAILIESGLDPSQRLAESQVWFGHWVHLPPQDSREAAIAVVETLKKKGVSDIYIEPSGPMQHSISLGVFSERSHAETRAGTIRKLGISPQIRDRYRDSSVYWVDFELPKGQVIDPSEYQSSPRRVLRLEGRPCTDDA